MWIDLDRPASRSWRVPVIALVAICAGLVGGFTATVAQAVHPRQVAVETHEVRFAIVGDGKVEYAALVTPEGVEQVASVIPHTVPVGTTVVLTVRSTIDTSCRILVDGVIVDEKTGGGGNSATCIWTVTR